MQVTRDTRYFIGFCVCVDVLRVFSVLSSVLGAWEGSRKRLGDAWGIIEGNLVLESRIWSYGRFGFEIVDSSFVLYVVLRSVVYVVDDVRLKSLIWLWFSVISLHFGGLRVIAQTVAQHTHVPF